MGIGVGLSWFIWPMNQDSGSLQQLWTCSKDIYFGIEIIVLEEQEHHLVTETSHGSLLYMQPRIYLKISFRSLVEETNPTFFSDFL